MIDVTRPVRLLRITHYDGSFYHPREYKPGELPSGLLVEGIVSQPEYSESPTVFSPFIGTFEATEIKIGVETPSATAINFSQATPPLILKRLQVNQATVDDLSALSGITVPTAKKVAEERQKSPLKDLADLESRVPLKGKWEVLREQLLFD